MTVDEPTTLYYESPTRFQNSPSKKENTESSLDSNVFPKQKLEDLLNFPGDLNGTETNTPVKSPYRSIEKVPRLRLNAIDASTGPTPPPKFDLQNFE